MQFRRADPVDGGFGAAGYQCQPIRPTSKPLRTSGASFSLGSGGSASPTVGLDSVDLSRLPWAARELGQIWRPPYCRPALSKPSLSRRARCVLHYRRVSPAQAGSPFPARFHGPSRSSIPGTCRRPLPSRHGPPAQAGLARWVLPSRHVPPAQAGLARWVLHSRHVPPAQAGLARCVLHPSWTRPMGPPFPARAVGLSCSRPMPWRFPIYVPCARPARQPGPSYVPRPLMSMTRVASGHLYRPAARDGCKSSRARCGSQKHGLQDASPAGRASGRRQVQLAPIAAWAAAGPTASDGCNSSRARCGPQKHGWAAGRQGTWPDASSVSASSFCLSGRCFESV